MPIIVLPVLCLIVSGTLAVCHNITYPIIETAAAERAEAARRDIIPQADEFVLVHADGLPRTVTEVYRTTNNTGYIFMMTARGYGGEIKIICGIDTDGKIIKSAVLAQTETRGLGTPVFDEPHAGQYWGRDKNGIENIRAISGATITSNAYKNSIRDALTAFDIVRRITPPGETL
jgi:electron transport complex protein RnfG